MKLPHDLFAPALPMTVPRHRVGHWYDSPDCLIPVARECPIGGLSITERYLKGEPVCLDCGRLGADIGNCGGEDCDPGNFK